MTQKDAESPSLSNINYQSLIQQDPGLWTIMLKFKWLDTLQVKYK